MFSALNEHSSTHRIAGQVGHMYSALKSSIVTHCIAGYCIVYMYCLAGSSWYQCTNMFRTKATHNIHIHVLHCYCIVLYCIHVLPCRVLYCIHALHCRVLYCNMYCLAGYCIVNMFCLAGYCIVYMYCLAGSSWYQCTNMFRTIATYNIHIHVLPCRVL